MKRILFWLIAQLGALALAFPQQLDPTFLALRRRADPPLRWDNVEGKPAWISGQPPRYLARFGYHGITLPPGSETVVRLGADETLRLVNPRGELRSSDLQIWLSSGTPLWREEPGEPSSDARSLLVSPRFAEGALVRVARPADRAEDLTVALFRSRRQARPLDLPEFVPLSGLPGRAVSLRYRDAWSIQTYHCSDSAHSFRVDVTGPLLLMIESRRRYVADDSSRQGEIWLRCRIDGRPGRQLFLSSRLEERHPLFVDGKLQPVGGEARSFLSIPAGLHSLEVSASASFYYRLFGFRGEAAPIDEEMSRWVESENRALALAADSGLREGGLAAARELLNLALKAGGDSWIESLGRNFLRQQTEFRSLHPVDLPQENRSLEGLFAIPALPAPGESAPEPAVFPQFPGLERDGLAGGSFYNLTAAGAGEKDAEFRFMLPEHSAVTWLRLGVIQPADAVERTLLLRFDCGMERRLRLQPVSAFPLPPAPGSGTEPMAVRLRLNQLDSFGWRRVWDLLPRFAAAVIEMELPAEARALTVSLENPVSGSLWIAVQQRLSTPWQLDETQLLDAMAALEPDFSTLFGEEPVSRQSPEDAFLLAALRAHTASCRRFLNSQRSQFAGPLSAPSNRRLQSAGAAGGAEERRLQERARQAEAGKEWHSALERWNELLYRGGAEVRADALLGRVRALIALDEDFLAEQQLKSIVLWEPDRTLVERAAEEYRRLIFGGEDRADKELKLNVTLAFQDPAPERLKRLCADLVAAGHTEYALMVGLPFSNSPDESLLYSALDRRCQHLMTSQLDRLATEERARWMGLRSALEGDFIEAGRWWSAAGETGKPWIEHLDEGLAIRQALVENNSDQAALMRRWGSWQQTNPGPNVWREAGRSAIEGDGWDLTYHVDFDDFDHIARSTKERPLLAEISGPGRWKIQIRPHHPHQEISSLLNDWAIVEIDGQVRDMPITSNRPNPKFDLVASDERDLGEKEEMVVTLGPGLHRLRVIPGRVPLAVRVFEERPLISLPVLPRLTAEVCRELFPGQAAVEPSPSGAPAEAARARMARLVREAEESPEEVQGKVGEAASAYFRHRDEADLAPLFRRLRGGSVWAPLGSAVESSGFLVADPPRTQPTAPFSRVRQALLPVTHGGTRLGFGEKLRTTYDLPSAPREMTVEAVLEVPDYLNPVPFRLLGTLDGKPFLSLILEEANAPRRSAIRIPSGLHVLEIGTENLAAGHTLRVALLERGEGGEWRETDSDRSLTFQAAAPGRPLVLQVPGPAWLRIDRWDEARGELVHEECLIDGPQSELRLEPATDRCGFRIFQRVFAPPGPQPAAAFEAESEPSPWARPTAWPPAGPPVLLDSYRLGGQEDGTWSAALALRSDHLLEEDWDENRLSPRHLDLTLSKRKYIAPKGLFWRAEATLRQQKNPLAALHFLVHRPALGRFFEWDIESFWYLQISSGISGGPPAVSSFFLSGRLAWRQSLTPRLEHRPIVKLFLRFLPGPFSPSWDWQELDLDVYSQYKNLHRSGLTLEDRLIWTNGDNSRLWLSAALTSNRLFGEMTPDHMALRAGWDARMSWLNLSLGYRFRHYWRDDDRSSPFSRHVVSAAFSWDHWLKNQKRLEFGGRFDHDLTRRTSSFSLFIAWHGGRGRGWRDFSPRDMIFRDDRQSLLERAGGTQNNDIRE